MHSLIFREGDSTTMVLFARNQVKFTDFVIELKHFCNGIGINLPKITDAPADMLLFSKILKKKSTVCILRSEGDPRIEKCVCSVC